jgi:hypothetical protein
MSCDSDAMLFSAESLQAIQVVKDQFGQALTQRALELAKRDGRTLVTQCDAWTAIVETDSWEVLDPLYHRDARLRAACRAARLVLSGTTAVDLVQQAAVHGAVVMLGEVIAEEEGSKKESEVKP